MDLPNRCLNTTEVSVKLFFCSALRIPLRQHYPGGMVSPLARMVPPLLPLLLLVACGGGEEDVGSISNDAARQEALIVNQAQALQAEAENGTSAIEQALENETANVFDNREALLNETADNGIADANTSR